MIGGSGEKVTFRLVAEHADQLNTFGDPSTVRHKNDVLNDWCAKIGRNPKEIERTIAVEPKELERAEEYAEAGADHLIALVGSPFDFTAVEKALAMR